MRLQNIIKTTLVKLQLWFSFFHLPILWLLCAGIALWVRGVKFRRIGHRFNNGSWAGTATTCWKWPCHLVNGCARGKGVLWLSRTCRVWILWECRGREERKKKEKSTQSSTEHNMQLKLMAHTKKSSAVAQSPTFPVSSRSKRLQHCANRPSFPLHRRRASVVNAAVYLCWLSANDGPK